DKPCSRTFIAQSFFLVCVLMGTAVSQSNDPPTVQAVSTTASITLDGHLDEPEWRDAPVLRLTQQAPRPGGPTPYQTEVRVIVSGDNLYFGFICKDPNPRAIAVHTMQRDGDMTGDDTVSIVLDTFGDRRTGYFFQINAAGARADGLISRSESASLD